MQAGPDLAVSNMVPRPIDLGLITEAAGETLEQFERYPLLLFAMSRAANHAADEMKKGNL
mgnify:CR=1 FL=1